MGEMQAGKAGIRGYGRKPGLSHVAAKCVVGMSGAVKIPK